MWLRPDVTAAMAFWRDDSERLPCTSEFDQIDFRPAMVDSRLFPFDLFRGSMARQLRRLEQMPAKLKSPQGNQGSFHLRETIARHIALTRAVVCDPDDVVITSGAQQAFDLLARILVTPDKTVVAVENPGYPPSAFRLPRRARRLLPSKSTPKA